MCIRIRILEDLVAITISNKEVAEIFLKTHSLLVEIFVETIVHTRFTTSQPIPRTLLTTRRPISTTHHLGWFHTWSLPLNLDME